MDRGSVLRLGQIVCCAANQENITFISIATTKLRMGERRTRTNGCYGGLDGVESTRGKTILVVV